KRPSHAGETYPDRRRDLAATEPARPRPDEGFSRTGRRGVARSAQEIRPPGRPERCAAPQRRRVRHRSPVALGYTEEAAAEIAWRNSTSAFVAMRLTHIARAPAH